MSEPSENLQALVTRTVNEGLDDFRMGRASNDELARRHLAICESVHANALAYGRLLGIQHALEVVLTLEGTDDHLPDWKADIDRQIEEAQA